jgi:cephalosporin hydroxylase
VNWAEANREFYWSEVWKTLRYSGHYLYKYPTDLWVYREIIERTQPAVIIEAGSGDGGSAAWFADYAEVISIDLVPMEQPHNDRISWLRGSSISTDVAEMVYQRVRGRRCLVSLDSRHDAEHVLAEIEVYAPLVHPGDYLVVEDTAVDEYGLDTEHYPDGGPGVAVREFLRQGTFESDPRCERFFLGMNPGGWLRRVT